LNLVTPNELRGVGIAFFLATSGLIGLGSGPLLVAMASEYLFHGEIGLGMAAVYSLLCPLGALLLRMGCGAMSQAVIAAER
jgi:hypothetical protein